MVAMECSCVMVGLPHKEEGWKDESPSIGLPLSPARWTEAGNSPNLPSGSSVP